jgi:hypothetical protein
LPWASSTDHLAFYDHRPGRGESALRSDRVPELEVEGTVLLAGTNEACHHDAVSRANL